MKRKATAIVLAVLFAATGLYAAENCGKHGKAEAKGDMKGCSENCVFMIKDASIDVKDTAEGVVITVKSSNKESVAKIQESAKNCAAQCKMKNKEEKKADKKSK